MILPFLQLKVDFSSLYDRVPHPNHELESSIEDVSQVKLASGLTVKRILKMSP
jgi:Tfp pilus assembly protein PilO